MDFRIESNELEQLEESTVRQLSTLYKTRRGSIPMHRDFVSKQLMGTIIN